MTDSKRRLAASAALSIARRPARDHRSHADPAALIQSRVVLQPVPLRRVREVVPSQRSSNEAASGASTAWRATPLWPEQERRYRSAVVSRSRHPPQRSPEFESLPQPVPLAIPGPKVAEIGCRTAFRETEVFRIGCCTALRETKVFEIGCCTALRETKVFEIGCRTALRETRVFEIGYRTTVRGTCARVIVVSVSRHDGRDQVGMGRRETRRNEARSGAPAARYPIHWGERLGLARSIGCAKQRRKSETTVRQR